jgi:hypothetical protein
VGMVDGQGAFEKEHEAGREEQTRVRRVRVSKWGWSMSMVPLRRKQSLVGRVRVSKWGWSMPMGPLRRMQSVVGRVRVF